ncbi:MAG TPA: trigger factor [Pyrinomonadaceae bacterium]
MKTEIVDVSPTRKELKIEIEASAVRAAYDRIAARYAKQASVPGFRPGHAPVSVVRTRFKDEIRSEVLRELVPEAVESAITENGLDLIGEPDVHLDNAERLEKIGEQPIGIHVRVEVWPPVELGEYKGLEAARRVRPVGDEDVEQMIEAWREQSSALQPVEDRAAQAGDIVTVNFNGKFVGEPEAEEINVEEVDVELGGANVQQEFTENLLGVRPDDERTFTVKYPEDFTSKGLAGKEVNYTAKVTAVRVKVLPELDDEWAKSLDEEFDSLKTLREKVQENLQERARAESDNRLRADLMRQLVEAHPFEVPETFVEQQTNQNLELFARNLLNRGIDPRTAELNWEHVRDSLKEQSARDVRGSILLDRIAEAEKIEVTDEEVAAEIDDYAEATRQTPEQVRAALTKQGGERSIAERLRNRKALDLILENARVADEEWREEMPADEGADDPANAADEAPDEAAASTGKSDAGSQPDSTQTESSTPED